MRRIIDQSLGNQVNPLGLKAIDDICEVDGMPLRESRLVVRQASDSGPNIFIGCTENSAVEDQPHKSFCNQNEKEKKKTTCRKIRKISSISESPGKRG